MAREPSLLSPRIGLLIVERIRIPADHPRGCAPLPTRPGVFSMWVRQCDLDGEADFLPPIPARIASNEEFVPPPQSPEQKEYEDRLADISEATARRQGRS